jgi:hypothetical protein
MINFNTNDYNMWKVERDSKLGNLECENEYKVYGLKQEDNPVVLIEYCFEGYTNIDNLMRKKLIQFFKKNGFLIKINSIDDESNKIYIGLRKDLRKYPVLAACVLQTIIYYFEDELELSDYKILGIPKLK